MSLRKHYKLNTMTSVCHVVMDVCFAINVRVIHACVV